MTSPPTAPNSAPLLHSTQEDDDGTKTGTEVVFSKSEGVTKTKISSDVTTKIQEIKKPEKEYGNENLPVRLKLKRSLTRPGVYYALISVLFFSAQGALTSAMASTMSPYQISAMIVPMTLIGSSTLVLCRGIPLPKEVKLCLWLLPSGITLSALFCFHAFSYKYISLADATTISSVSLIFVGIFSWIILREPLRLIDFLFAFIALAGVVFIARPSFLFRSDEDEFEKETSLLGILFALGAAVTAAATVVFVRKQATLGIHSLVTSASNCIHVEVINLIICTAAGQWQLPTKNEWLFSLGAGCSYFVAQVSMYLSLKTESATVIVVIGTLSIILAFVWQFLFFHVTPLVTSYVGGALVIFACIGIVLKKEQIERKTQVVNEL